MADLKYVDIKGRVAIEFGPEPDTKENVLILSFLDSRFVKIPHLKPLYFYLTDRDDPNKPNPVKFAHADLTAEFNFDGFARVKETLQEINPLIGEWNDLEDSNKRPDMNPSGPPK